MPFRGQNKAPPDAAGPRDRDLSHTHGVFFHGGNRDFVRNRAGFDQEVRARIRADGRDLKFHRGVGMTANLGWGILHFADNVGVFCTGRHDDRSVFDKE